MASCQCPCSGDHSLPGGAGPGGNNDSLFVCGIKEFCKGFLVGVVTTGSGS